jgi:hypothetical protein
VAAHENVDPLNHRNLFHTFSSKNCNFHIIIRTSWSSVSGFVLGRSRVQISSRILAILTEVILGLSQSFQTNARIVL